MTENSLMLATQQLSICLPKLPHKILEKYTENSKLKKYTNTSNLKPAVPCPSCANAYKTLDECTRHLLKECLQIKRSDDAEACRGKLTNWIIEYFKFHKLRMPSWQNLNSDNNSQIYNIKVIIEDCCSSSKRARLEVRIPEIPFDVKCPVCHTYFNTSTACFNHLFQFCLFVKNSDNALLVKKWLLEFPWSTDNTRRLADNYDNIISVFDKQLVCKYCKLEIIDEHYLKKHFRLFHFQENELDGAECLLCNFNALSFEKLVVHFIIKHIKCGCGAKATSFSLLKKHFRLCMKNLYTVCPLCSVITINSFDTEKDLGKHLRSCPPPTKVKLSLDDVYFNCDVCHQNVLKSCSEKHLQLHLERADCARQRQRRVFINLSDIGDIIEVEQLKKLQKLFTK